MRTYIPVRQDLVGVSDALQPLASFWLIGANGRLVNLAGVDLLVEVDRTTGGPITYTLSSGVALSQDGTGLVVFNPPVADRASYKVAADNWRVLIKESEQQKHLQVYGTLVLRTAASGEWVSGPYWLQAERMGDPLVAVVWDQGSLNLGGWPLTVSYWSTMRFRTLAFRAISGVFTGVGYEIRVNGSVVASGVLTKSLDASVDFTVEPGQGVTFHLMGSVTGPAGFVVSLDGRL